MQADIETLINRIDRGRLVSSLKKMIHIRSVNPFDEPPSPGHREFEYGLYLQSALQELGFETGERQVVEGRNNVWAKLAGSGDGPSLMLAGHIDTVGVEHYPDAFEPREANGRVYGRGACDMKGAFACYLEAARLIVESGLTLKGDLFIAGIIDEEWKMIGSKDMGTHGPHADYGVIGEPTELVVCPAHKGEYASIIKTRGRAVHASVPEHGHNAIVDMARIVSAFDGYDDELRQRQPHALCGHGRFSIGVIRGGTMVAVVPDACELEVDRRTLPGETRAVVEKEYTDRLQGLLPDEVDAGFELGEPLIHVDALDVPEDSPVVQAVVQAYAGATGRDAVVKAFPAATDAPNLGFPAVVFGPGSLEQAHTIDEYVEIEELVSATRVYLGTILHLLA